MATEKQSSIRCGALVREARIRHGLSQGDLGLRSGMAQSAISRIERNAVSPSVDTLGRIFEAMGETVSIRAVPLSEPLPEAGNQSIAELRRSGRLLTPEERLLEAVELSEAATRLAAQA